MSSAKVKHGLGFKVSRLGLLYLKQIVDVEGYPENVVLSVLLLLD